MTSAITKDFRSTLLTANTAHLNAAQGRWNSTIQTALKQAPADDPAADEAKVRLDAAVQREVAPLREKLEQGLAGIAEIDELDARIRTTIEKELGGLRDRVVQDFAELQRQGS